MFDQDRIDKGLWWDAAWRVNSGCTKVSPGCDHCWAEMELAIRSKSPNKKIAAQWPGNFQGDVRLLPDNLEKVLKARTPKAWAIWNDLFHEDVPFDYADKVLMTFLFNSGQLGIILTKRIERAAKYCDEVIRGDRVKHALYCDRLKIPDGIKIQPSGFPPYRLPTNIWLGTTAEDQQRLEERAIHLLKCPASLLFLSLEPLLGPMDLLKYFADIECGECDWLGFTDNDTPEGGLQKVYKGDDDWNAAWDEYDPDDDGLWICPKCKAYDSYMSYVPLHDPGGNHPRIGWVIVGAESRGGGIGRECKIEWVRKIVEQCKAAGVPVFVKQLHIEGKLVKDIGKFPPDLRLREIPVFGHRGK